MTQVTLQYPLDRDGQTISTVTVRRPTAGDMIAIGDAFRTMSSIGEAGVGADEFRAMTEIAGQLTGLGGDADKLDFGDLQSILNSFEDAAGNSQPGPVMTG